ncbi:MAG: phosphoenolpyruvate carboxykinase (GTP), partial [Candidatus Binataceae bacterium]
MVAEQIKLTSNRASNSPALDAWIGEVAQLTAPDHVVWLDGSADEKRAMLQQAVQAGVLIPLSQSKRPGCYLHRSNLNDVARSEEFTLVCSPSKDDAGPTNNWAPPDESYA